jgi:hypothetical protein
MIISRNAWTSSGVHDSESKAAGTAGLVAVFDLDLETGFGERELVLLLLLMLVLAASDGA